MQIISGKRTGGRRILLAGTPKIGKTSWAAGAPRPIILGIGADMDGAGDLPAPTPDRVAIRSTSELHSAIRECATSDYSTVVLDSITAAEAAIHRDVAIDADKSSIGEIGYGRGYESALAAVHELLAALDTLIRAGKHVIVIAHVTPRKTELPGMDAYDAYTVALQHSERISARNAILQWADDCLFAVLDMRVAERDGRAIAIGGTAPIIHARPGPCWPWAGSRLASIPATLAMPHPRDGVGLGWAEYAQYLPSPWVQITVRTIDLREHQGTPYYVVATDLGEMIVTSPDVRGQITEGATVRIQKRDRPGKSPIITQAEGVK